MQNSLVFAIRSSFLTTESTEHTEYRECFRAFRAFRG